LIKTKYQWKTKAEGIVKDEEIFKTILKNRKISNYEIFFSMGKEHLHDPFLLNDMQKAVNRIKSAIKQKEKIIIFGDYDCDGITAIAVLVRTLRHLGADIDFDLPDRFYEGYGLNMRAVEDIISNGYKLVITVDNGITCVEEVESLKNAGIDTIITDHHEAAEVIPDAYAIVHPKLSPEYPFTEIAGVMVAYKLAQALSGHYLENLFDLVMIGTIADLMPLDNENQAMVNLGIEVIKNTKNIGLKKLIEFSNLDIINVTAIAFKIAPKINSSGRLNQAKSAVELLITEDIKIANDLIIDIEKNHDLRKRLTEEAFLICEENVNPKDSILVVASKDLHEGVIGICAQRLVEKYQKSTIVITTDEHGMGKGSARAFGDANILEILNQTSEYLEKYGGHSQAAGMQINLDKLDDFKAAVNKISVKEANPILDIDMEVYLPNLNIETIKNIQDKSFFTASYLMKGLRVVRKQILNRKHTKLQLEIDGYFIDALDFNSLEFYYILNPNDIVEICGGLNVNTYRGRDSLQIMIKDVACDHLQIYDYRKNADSILEYVKNAVVYNDTSIIEEEKLETKIKEELTVCMLPRDKKYNLNQIIDRSELGKIYKMLQKRKRFLPEEVKESSYSDRIILTAIKIFTELSLLETDKDGYVTINNNSTKMDLNDSPTYKNTLNQFQQINFLYQSDYMTLKKYFEQILEEVK
jgi:single-stranded-DNA-specific exonuclease